MPSTARAISLTLPTSRTPAASAAGPDADTPPPIASFLRASDRSRSSFLRSSIKRGDARRHVVERGAQLGRRRLRQRHGVVGMLAGMMAGQRLDAANA